jgi:hypothetical protein
MSDDNKEKEFRLPDPPKPPVFPWEENNDQKTEAKPQKKIIRIKKDQK